MEFAEARSKCRTDTPLAIMGSCTTAVYLGDPDNCCICSWSAPGTHHHLTAYSNFAACWKRKKKKKIYIACHWREQEISAKVLCKIKGFIKNTSHMMLSSTGDDLLQGKSTNSHYCFDQKASFPPALQYGPVCWTPGNRPHQGYLKHCCTLPLFSGWLPSAYQRSTEHKKQKPHLRG